MWSRPAIARSAATVFRCSQSIIQHHLDGTHFNIHVDPEDGLISAAAEGYQLTWMDAKVDGWVVTPRRGKPVEIQALWHNALQLMAQLGERARRRAPRSIDAAAQVRESFNQRYWNEQRGCLYDVVDGPDGNDDGIRPNQIFALSLQHPVLYQRHWKQVVDMVRDQLLTPYGLRTLSAGSPGLQSALSRQPARARCGLSPGNGVAMADRALHRCVSASVSGSGGARALLRGVSRSSLRCGRRQHQRDLRCRRAATRPAAAWRRHGAWPKCCGRGCARDRCRSVLALTFVRLRSE